MLQNVLAQIPDKPARMSLPASVVEYLESHQVPTDIVEDLKESSFADWIVVGPLNLIPFPRILEETSGIPECMENGFLPLAGGTNGDPGVADTETRAIFFVEYCTLKNDFAKSLLPIPFTYDNFWESVVKDADFPSDFYAAEERWAPEDT